ncbi:hypothetical protein SCB49_08873 [unidentified eubacterium SCB49]|nr:hypothetical protein SCB49_08873 [unidentified eubacterium SCB49]
MDQVQKLWDLRIKGSSSKVVGFKD